MITQVCFDLDGTLVDSYRDIAGALNEVLHALGRPAHDPQEVKTMIGHGVGVLLERGLGSEDPKLVDRAKALFKDAYRARLFETTRCYDGVLEMIAELEANGIATSIATNKPSWFTRPLIEHLKIPVRAHASADEAGHRKPNPRVIELAIERTERPFEKHATLYVGDMPIDFETARACGIRIAGVSWGFDPSALKRLAPDHFLDRPSDLFAVIRPR